MQKVQKVRIFQNPIVCYLGLTTLILFIFYLFPQSSFQEDFLYSQDCHSFSQKICFEQKETILFNDVQALVLGKNSFQQVTPPTIIEGRSFATLTSLDNEKKEITEYIVKEGDTISSIAEKFGISLNTILWANDLSQNSKISPGQKLTILPVSGVMHLVGKGESISWLAAAYKVEPEEMMDVNDIEDESKIYRGDILIIPGAKPLPEPTIQYAPLASSYFICPLSSCRITQGLHWYNAVDFGSSCGSVVFAAAGGTVQRTGYDSVAGKYVRILHPNGIVTFYGHLSVILASPGQQVSQGSIIGYVGNTGHTVGATGCHVHFEVRGARNPFAY